MSNMYDLPVTAISGQFSRLHHAALNTALDDRTRLAMALRGLLTAVQLAMPNMAPAHLLRAEEAAIEALQAVGEPDVETPA